MAKLLSVLLCLFLLIPVWGQCEGSSLSLLAVNVGKGDALLLSSGESLYLIDTGSASAWGKLSAVLTERGIDHLDGVILTHTDDDHAGGLPALATSSIQVDAWYASACYTGVKEKKHPAVLAATMAGETVQWLRAGDSLPLDGGTLTVLGPLKGSDDRENNNSLVLLAETDDGSILLTGDMEPEEENDLLSAGLISPCTVLKVPDHGEDHATTSALIRAAAPTIAVISTDSGEEKDTPSTRVLRELKSAGASVAVTQYGEAGVLVTLQTGQARCEYISHEAWPEATEGVIISDRSVAQDIICLKNTGDGTADLSGWYLYSDRGDELFVFPEGTTLEAGASLSVSSLASESAGDLVWPDKRVWNEEKEDNAFLYDAYGRLMAEY